MKVMNITRNNIGTDSMALDARITDNPRVEKLAAAKLVSGLMFPVNLCCITRELMSITRKNEKTIIGVNNPAVMEFI
jgi:hypothetical protein